MGARLGVTLQAVHGREGPCKSLVPFCPTGTGAPSPFLPLLQFGGANLRSYMRPRTSSQSRAPSFIVRLD